ncbi:hypothetical protein RQP46_006603 [Phenoliferia psychrophenolica]
MVKATVDEAERQRHYSATVMGGFKTSSIGLGTTLAASVAAQRYGFRAYRHLTLPVKAFACTAVTVMSFTYGADAAARQFEQDKYTNQDSAIGREGHRAIQAERAAGIYQGDKVVGRMEGMTTQRVLLEWAKEHRYGVVFSGWGASMIGTFAYIAATPLTFTQKLVQARMAAQGLTLVVLLASAGLSAMPAADGSESEDELKRDFRESTMYKWKKGSAHDLAVHAKEEANATT